MAPLKLFFQMPFNAIGWKPELELIRRFETVCRSLGHECFSSPSAQDALDVGADVIFTLHFTTAKVTPIFTVGLVWNPISFLHKAGSNSFLKTLSLDGHFYAGESLRAYFGAFSRQGYRINDFGDFYPSAPKTDYVPVEAFGLPTYVGSLWQEGRHQPLFDIFNKQRAIKGYGTGLRWAEYGEIYQGAFPLDAGSYMDVYRRTGIGLCLHSGDHLEDNVPTTRIFEIAASGCVAICDDLPFTRKEFGDCVFYLDHTQSVSGIASQLREIVAGIHAKPARAREMARAAHDIFVRKFSLDHLLKRGLEQIAEYRKSRRRQASQPSDSSASVQIFTRTRGSRPCLLRRALRSLASQTHGRVRSTLIYHGSDANEFSSGELLRLREEFAGLEIDLITVAPSEPLSETIPAAIRHGEADFIGFVDDDDWVFPNHVETLLEALASRPKAMIAVSGTVVHYEYLLNSTTPVPVYNYGEGNGELLSFEPVDFAGLRKGEEALCCSSLLLRNNLRVDWTKWPRAQIGEERALLALIAQSHKGGAVFTSRVSCVWSNRQMQCDNQIDRLGEPGFYVQTPLFSYQSPVPTRLKGNGLFPHLYPWRAQMEKREALDDLLKAHRWLPRWLRPLFYQQKFNALLVSMIEDSLEKRFIAVPDSVDFSQLKAACQRSGPSTFVRQEQIHRAMGKILATREIHVENASGRHASNLKLARAVKRLGQSC